MNDVTHVVGIDPGLVHTGCVRMVFHPDMQLLQVGFGLVAGPDVDAVARWVNGTRVLEVPPTIFIEDYRPRQHYAADPKMMAAVSELRRVTGGEVLANTGVKKTVRPELMDLLGVWKFPLVSHHQDLRSAARIALLGMVKNDTMNRLLADFVNAHLNNKGWVVQSKQNF